MHNISENYEKTETLLKRSKVKSRRIIEDADISDMFGIKIETIAVKKKKVKKANP